MTKLGLGTVQFGLDYGIINKSGQIKKAEAKEIIKLAKKNNIDLLDTAINYGDSEKILGQIGISNFNIVTKLPNCPINSLDIISWVKTHIVNSLKRLGINSLYGLLIHRSDNLTGSCGRKIKDALHQLKSEGLVKKIGVSIYNPTELEKIIQTIQLDIVQAPINLIDQRLESSGWMQRLHDEGIEIHARSIFLQGLLLSPRKKIPNKFERWGHIWDKWEYEQKKNKKSPMEMCLSYSLLHPKIDKIIVGVDSPSHFNSIIVASKNVMKLNDSSIIKANDPMLINPFNWDKL
jgi:aryl-alcohol dehydrogenase-like predicted oxidoreductase